MSRIGAAHIRKDLPCQDASHSEDYNGAQIAVVADGHGSRRHFRSERGSSIACRVAAEEIRTFLDESASSELSMDEQLTALKRRICDSWATAVREDYEQEPWTESELAEERALLSEEQFALLAEGTDYAIAYGSTLLAAFTFDGGWAALQLGDGGFTRISSEGVYDWLMPESLVNEGNRTASLCMREPMRDFRHCFGSDHPVGLLVYTDGIEKVFPPQGKAIVSLLHWIWRNEYAEETSRKDNLQRTLDMLTSRSPVGDDVSVAGLVDPESDDAVPVAGYGQQKQELDRLYARMEELDNSIAYNQTRLRQLGGGDSTQDEAKEQVKKILQRNKDAAVEIRERINELREALFLEPEAFDEPEPDPLPENITEPETDPESDDFIWPERETGTSPRYVDFIHQPQKRIADLRHSTAEDLFEKLQRMMDDIIDEF